MNCGYNLTYTLFPGHGTRFIQNRTHNGQVPPFFVDADHAKISGAFAVFSKNPHHVAMPSFLGTLANIKTGVVKKKNRALFGIRRDYPKKHFFCCMELKMGAKVKLLGGRGNTTKGSRSNVPSSGTQPQHQKPSRNTPPSPNTQPPQGQKCWRLL